MIKLIDLKNTTGKLIRLPPRCTIEVSTGIIPRIPDGSVGLISLYKHQTARGLLCLTGVINPYQQDEIVLQIFNTNIHKLYFEPDELMAFVVVVLTNQFDAVGWFTSREG